MPERIVEVLGIADQAQRFERFAFLITLEIIFIQNETINAPLLDRIGLGDTAAEVDPFQFAFLGPAGRGKERRRKIQQPGHFFNRQVDRIVPMRMFYFSHRDGGLMVQAILFFAPQPVFAYKRLLFFHKKVFCPGGTVRRKNSYRITRLTQIKITFALKISITQISGHGYGTAPTQDYHGAFDRLIFAIQYSDAKTACISISPLRLGVFGADGVSQRSGRVIKIIITPITDDGGSAAVMFITFSLPGAIHAINGIPANIPEVPAVIQPVFVPLMILATRQHVRAWEGELESVYRSAAWFL